ncbi:twin-arginine translocation signal domain-containing protein [Verrucomicrobium spinosum]|nr:twin-arginine translocation signal domain-containing protein [Verrucomicrobium spinosum]
MKTSRRDFLVSSALAGGVGMLASCERATSC